MMDEFEIDDDELDIITGGAATSEPCALVGSVCPCCRIGILRVHTENTLICDSCGGVQEYDPHKLGIQLIKPLDTDSLTLNTDLLHNL